ncbi:MAG: hypothetical protein NVV82_10155 [Sporocytophaga sp.]|nr:hypothetical protein [Sporocytophaga sp.]
MKTRTKLIIFLLACFPGFFAFAGDPPSEEQKSSAPLLLRKLPVKKILGLKSSTSNAETPAGGYKRWSGLKYSGYARSFTQYRVMPNYYSGNPNLTEKSLVFNGVEAFNGSLQGYQEPLFLLRLEGNPTARTFFKIEYAMDNQLTGVIKDNGGVIEGTNTAFNRRISTYRILQFEGSANTGIGDFKLIAGGGVLWHRVSPFTFWNYEYRDDLFERYPWEPEGASFNRYNQFYATQNIARDARWGNTATQGFILEAKNMPLGFGGNIVYGKTDNSGGFTAAKTKSPRNLVAGRLDKGFGMHKFGLNYFNQFGFLDIQELFKIRQQIATIDGRLNLNNVKIYFEGGVGRFQDFIAQRDQENVILNNYSKSNVLASKNPMKVTKGDNYGTDYNWAPTIMGQIDVTKEAFNVPVNLMMYYIDKAVTNINSQVMNTANPHALGTAENIGSIYDITTYYGGVTDIQQMANNRWGGYLKHEDTYGKLKVNIGTGFAQEIENLYDSISFQHRANSFTRSRFAFFTRNNGPYGNIMNIYRRAFEVLAITDTVSDYKKGFNSIDLNLKYKLSFLGRELILSNYNNYSSVQPGFSAIPKFSDKAFLRYFYEEFMAFYAFRPKLTLIGFVSYEKALGNNRTQLADANGEMIIDETTKKPIADPNGKPINQRGYGYGLGFDYDFSGRAGLYVRHRWFDHRDVNFTKDRFNGQETTVELKIFF